MLLRFNVTNFLSFKENQMIEFYAGKAKLFKDHTITNDKYKGAVLKTAIVYGANASGKSNLIKAMDFSRRIIVDGIETVDTINKYFRLDEKSKNTSTVFQYEIDIDGKYYDYGFVVELIKKEIVEEWLFEKNPTSEKQIFHRDKDKKIINNLKLKNQNDKKRFQFYGEDLKNNELFIKELATKDWEDESLHIFKKIYDWFSKKFSIVFPETKFGTLIFMENYDKLQEYLKSFDTGIEEVKLLEKNFEEWLKTLHESIRINISNSISTLEKNTKTKIAIAVEGNFYIIGKFSDSRNQDLMVKEINFNHSNNPELNELFELFDESDGTRRLIELIPLLHGLTEEGKTIVIDEVDRSLHPALTKKLFQLFYEKTKGKKSQLIVTTHESTLLDLNLVRRDEVWFIERKKDKSSMIYSLDQFEVRYDKKIDKAYFLGRYGGVPLFKNFNFLQDAE
ncbi:MAG: AAA family ATPase [Fusobacteriaceae bacterium]